MPLSSNPRISLNKHGLAPSKKRGQNFLVNPQTAQRIVAIGNYHKNECVVEVGVGLGALTAQLAALTKQVIGIEIDRGIIRYHEEEHDLPDNVQLIHDDILKTDFTFLGKQAGKPFKIIANLPYSISNPFIFKLVENKSFVSQVIVMLQKEVSDRLTAEPGTKAYGIPTVLLGSFATIKKHLLLKPSEFHPRPKIDSEVIEIQFNHREISCSLSCYQKVVRTAFNNRRKTLLNNLINPSLFSSPPFSDRSKIKNAVLELLENTTIDPQIRAERLTIKQFEILAAAYEQFVNSHA